MIREPKRKPPNGGSLAADRGPAYGDEAFRRREERIAAARAGQLVWMSAEEGAEYLGVSAGRFRDAASKSKLDRYKDLGGDRHHCDDLNSYRRRRGPKAC